MTSEDGVVVCYYTKGPYEAEAARLIWSLQQLLDVRYYVQEAPTPKNWLEGVHMRARFLQHCRKMFPDQVLLSVDADAYVHSDPWAGVPDCDCDIAVHTFKRAGRQDEMLPGTLVLWPTDGTDNLLAIWAKQNKKTPDLPDRKTFALAVRAMRKNLKIAELPPEMAWIFDLSRNAYGQRTPIIEHLQASRSNRNPSGPMDISRMARILEIDRGRS
ncbi:MAG TPA: hypothetical protein PK309_07870 [Bacillota bacterium]|nr:hypothetical protein [Bacillota bacterium]